jgi:hypothetical protein
VVRGAHPTRAVSGKARIGRMPGLLNIVELPETTARPFRCVEIYLPKRLKHLSELYAFLRNKVTQRLADLVLDGLSIYEVDGVFRGSRQIWEERTLVIRILLPPLAEQPLVVLEGRIQDLGRELCLVAGDEEEIWICSYPQNVSVFKPTQVEQVEGGGA